MGTRADHRELTAGLDMGCDCPLCGLDWAACAGSCADHETPYGMMGPFHRDYNDDCPECALFHPEEVPVSKTWREVSVGNLPIQPELEKFCKDFNAGLVPPDPGGGYRLAFMARVLEPNRAALEGADMDLEYLSYIICLTIDIL